MSEALLEMTGINKTFGGVIALEDASMTIGTGEAHTVVGQNGAGKSTLIKILTGVYRRTSGDIRWCGSRLM